MEAIPSEDLPQVTQEAFEASRDFCITKFHAFQSLLFLLGTVFWGKSFDIPGYLQWGSSAGSKTTSAGSTAWYFLWLAVDQSMPCMKRCKKDQPLSEDDRHECFDFWQMDVWKRLRFKFTCFCVFWRWLCLTEICSDFSMFNNCHVQNMPALSASLQGTKRSLGQYKRSKQFTKFYWSMDLSWECKWPNPPEMPLPKKWGFIYGIILSLPCFFD